MWNDSFIEMMQKYLLNLQLPKMEVIDFIEVILLAVLFYSVAKALRGTRAWILLKGILMLAVLYILAYVIGLKVTVIIFKSIMLLLVIALVVIMQPELRRFVEKIGTNKISGSIEDILKLWKYRKSNVGVTKRYSDETITEIVRACSRMSAEKTGALIVIEADIPLNEYIETGIKINSDITSALLINIFEPNTPLHDGAIIIRDNKIMSGTCYLPLSDSKKINKDLGTRHRAGLGLAEITDGMVIIVSEETGAITFVVNGEMYRHLDREGLTEKLKQNQVKETIEIRKDRIRKRKYTDALFNNLGLKLSSIIIVIMMWGIVINTVDPVITKKFNNIPIEVINEQAIRDMDLTYSLDGSNTTNVKITDRKSNIDLMKSADIKILADLKELSLTKSVLLSASVAGYPDAVTELSKTSISVDIEEIITTEIGVETKLTGKSNDKYFISNIELDCETVTISGAKSIINKIGSAVIEINQSSLVNDTQMNCELQVFDKNGERIDSKLLNINNTTIGANITLFETKEVPINITTTLKNEKLKKLVQKVSYSTDYIHVAGNKEDIDNIDSIDIEVPVDVNIGEVSKSKFIKNIDINEYIKESNILVPNEYSKVQIELTFNQFNVMNKSIKKDDINIVNKNDNYSYNIVDDSLDVVVISNGEIKEDIKLNLYIDANNMKNGLKSVPLNLNEQGGIALYNEVLVNLQVSKR